MDFPFVDTVIVQLNPVCMQDLRQIDFSKDNFYLLPVNPNPATTSAIKITYSVGYECFTEIEIYNSYGELISKPINSILPEGIFAIKLNADKLSSGIYFCRMSSGPYQSIRQFVVTK